MNSPQPINRRSFLKKALLTGAGVLSAGGLLSGYSYGIEPKWMEITQVKLTFDRLPPAFHGKRLLQFSDIHVGLNFDLMDLSRIVDIITEQEADLICFTGDFFDSWISEDPDRTSEVLTRLQAPLGKWAAIGNHDYYAGSKETVRILKNGGFTTLINSHTNLTSASSTIQLAGVDDMSRGKPNLTAAVKGANKDLFTILLSHSANFADQAIKEAIDLQLSGHSHGGQVRLPFIGPLVTPPNGDKYVMGHYHVPGSQLQVYTNRGIGTSIHPIRFMCRPEITVITLQSSAI
ncbi:putative metallophosphoesterase [compost metagenome]